jgi:Ribbon-helix-helix protein, copG family
LGKQKVATGENKPQRARRGRPPKTQRSVQANPDRTRALKLRRFELKLSEIDFERVERLLGLTGAASMGEVIRDAVREYEAKILSGKKPNK